MSSKGTVLITGINGYIAGNTAKEFLNAGYSVRGTARSLARTKELEAALKPYLDAGQLTIVEVPDITAPGAFDGAVRDVRAILHLAQPVSLSFTDPEPVIRAAREGTRSVLASALAHAGPSLRVVALAASIASVLGGKAPGALYTEADWNPVDADALPAGAPGRLIYAASKTAMERAFWGFRDAAAPPFAMAAVNPAFVAGAPAALPADPRRVSESARVVLDVLAGADGDLQAGDYALRAAVHVGDVARLFRWVVENAAAADGQRFIAANGQAGNGQAIADILREAYPERRGVIKEGEPGKGYAPGFAFTADGINFDNSKATKATGIKWIPYKETILETAKAFEKYL